MKENIKINGNKLIDNYKNGAEKLYVLCDNINKKAMKWYALNIEFSEEEVELITEVQGIMEETNTIIKSVNEKRDLYDYINRGYAIFMYDCIQCDGKLKMDSFGYFEQGYKFNVYKCVKCGVKFEDRYPNTYEECVLFFNGFHQKYIDKINSPNISEEDRDYVKIEIRAMQIVRRKVLNLLVKMDKDSEPIIEEIKFIIRKNGELYSKVIKYKHHFDKN